jgi:surface protein
MQRWCSPEGTLPVVKYLFRCLLVGSVVFASATLDFGFSVQASSLPATSATPADLFCGFVDVPFQSYYTEASCHLSRQGITTGAGGPTRYAPEGQVSRAQMAAFLWRSAGSPAGPSSCGFADVDLIPLYARVGACWLKGRNITTTNPYNPAGLVTRAQMAAFLWRAAGSPETSPSCGFRDVAVIATWARSAACWLLQQGITTNNPYGPGGIVTRAQMAAFLWRADGRPVVPKDDPGAFVVWFDTSREPGMSVTLPLRGRVSAVIDWGDGTSESVSTPGNVTHLYATDGYYKVTITGTLERYGVRCGVAPDVAKLIALPAFGEVGLTSIEWAFSKASNLGKVARLLPNGVDSIDGAFGDPDALPAGVRNNCVEQTAEPNDVARANSFVAPSALPQGSPDWSTVDISQWDTARITDMSYLFMGQREFNQDISRWDTSNVTTMSGMFWGASSFNQPIGSWNTSNVTDMEMMFWEARAFNQPIGGWNTSNVTTMAYMFSGLETGFNQPIGGWNTSKVTNMAGMFYGADVFNRPIGTWDTSKVTNMAAMFAFASAFNQPIGTWNTSQVRLMSATFNGARSFNQPIGNWNTGSVVEMTWMFVGANMFNQPIGSWDTSKVESMSGMFYFAPAFNQPLGAWNTSNVTVMRQTFSFATSFNQDLSSWATDRMGECNEGVDESEPQVSCWEDFDTGASSWTLPRPPGAPSLV